MLFACVALTTAAKADVVADRFDTSGAGRGDDANDALDVRWFTRAGGTSGAQATIDADGPAPGGIVSDTLLSGGSPNNALEVTQHFFNDSFKHTTALVGALYASNSAGSLVPASVTLTNQLRLSVDLQFTTSSGFPQNQTVFYVGLYDSNGTPASADGDAALDNDRGYAAFLPIGASKAGTAFESGSSAGLMMGSDFGALGYVSMNGLQATKYTAVLTLTPSITANGVNVNASVYDASGTLLAQQTSLHSSGFLTSFNEILIGAAAPQANNVAYDFTYHIDNVSLAVPEPAGACAVALAAGIAAFRRRARGRRAT
jgi:hypothetical protein